MTDIYANRPVGATPVATPVGATAYDLAPDLEDYEDSLTMNIDCASCTSGNVKSATVSMRFLLSAIIDEETPVSLLQQQHITQVREEPTLGVSPVELQAQHLQGFGAEAVRRRLLPFNPYAPSARHLQKTDTDFPAWRDKVKAYLGEDSVELADPAEDAEPTTGEMSVKEVIAILDADPTRVDEIEDAERDRPKPRTGVLSKIVAIRKQEEG